MPEGCYDRIVFGILLDQVASHGKVEDGLAELLDLIGTGGETRQVSDEELGVGAKRFRIRSAVEVMMGCRC